MSNNKQNNKGNKEKFRESDQNRKSQGGESQNRGAQARNERGSKNNRDTKSQQDPIKEQTEITEVLDITTLAEYKSLVNELDQANKKIMESLDLAKIYKADMERIKERAKADELKLEEKLTIELSQKLLIVLDNFEKSFDHINDESDLKGFKMIYQSLVGVLKNMGVEKIDVSGKDFDADIMNAIMSEQPQDKKDSGKVSKVFAEGYMYFPTNKVVRYAQVSVYS